MSTPQPPTGLHALAAQVSDVRCRDVLEEVYLYLDGEASPAERRMIAAHLDECGPCLRKYGIEQEVKALVARSCGKEDTPTALRERVLTTLRSVTMSEDGSAVSMTTTVVTTDITVTRGQPD